MIMNANPQGDADMALERETETFQRELPALLDDPEKLGKYALVHGDVIDSVWKTIQEALDAGYERFGIEPFLVKEIVEHEKPVYFSRNLKRCQ